ncbi:hypothetical protein JQX14_17990 [Sulfitobacter pseudonitzschiae]|uniref:HNH nuclease domain-containing protein n=1 Tax=Pseudosulfitobacter pseudonitzschiae TaxID=1402135 RepID=A0A9Q2NQK9_9RHOB|nr:hypothetical protein [Pseudosulfitobacter pseudonitzschiae]
MFIPRINQSDVDRFWQSVEVRSPDECWLWTGLIQTKEKPYGRFILQHRSTEILAHRFSLQLKVGRRLTEDEMSCHDCDNTICCNQNHLYVGNAQTNAMDCKNRGRHGVFDRSLENNGNAKLNSAAVEVIKKRITAGETNVRIAQDYPVTHSMISKIRKGLSWGK